MLSDAVHLGADGTHQPGTVSDFDRPVNAKPSPPADEPQGCADQGQDAGYGCGSERAFALAAWLDRMIRGAYSPAAMNCFGTLSWVLMSVGWAGQQVPPAETVPPQVRLETVSPQVLILMDESTVVGRFERQADGSVRRLDGVGTIFPKRQVARLCESAEEAYLCLRGRANLQDPHERFRLAQWCLRHGLPNFARVEAQAALGLMPEFPAARQVLAQAVQAERTLKEKEALPAAGAVAVPRSSADESALKTGSRSRDGSAALRDATAPAGSATPSGLADLDRQANLPLAAVNFAGWEQMLQPQELQEYTRAIQPILINGCGSGACHGNPARREAGFYLLRGYDGRLSSQQTRANLAQVLMQIDKERPSQSPLLRHSILPHGGSDRLPFGSADAAAVQVLSAWVRRIAPEPQAGVVDASLVPTGGAGPLMPTVKSRGESGETTFAVDGQAGSGPTAMVAPPLRPEPRPSESGSAPGSVPRSSSGKAGAEPATTSNSSVINQSTQSGGPVGQAMPPLMSLGGKVVSGPLRSTPGVPTAPGSESAGAPSPPSANTDPFDPAEFNRQHHPGRGL